MNVYSVYLISMFLTRINSYKGKKNYKDKSQNVVLQKMEPVAEDFHSAFMAVLLFMEASLFCLENYLQTSSQNLK